MPLVGFTATLGVPPPELLRAARLDPALFAGPDIDVPHADELRLWAAAARLSGDDDFGLHLAEWLAPRAEESFDVLAFALRCCATLGEHYRRASRYLRLVHEGIYLNVEEGPELAHLVHGHHVEPADPPRHPVEGFLALTLLIGRRWSGVELVPREVHFVHARPARSSDHERIFRSPVHFGAARNELVLDRALLASPQLHAEPRLLAVLNRQLDGLLSEIPERERFRDVVERCMMDELPDREPSIAVIAEKQHMSPRTLQRRLANEGTSFVSVLSDVRRALAVRYLRDQRIAIGEVGFLLGFRDVTAFHRAFRRWTGTTPAKYRRTPQASDRETTGVSARREQSR